MLSRDASGLNPSSATAGRWRLLRDAGVTLDIVVATRSTATWNEAGIHVLGTGGGRIAKFFRTRRIATQLVASVDLVTAQDPFELGFVAWRIARRTRKLFEIQDHGGFFDGEKPDEPFWPIRSRLAWWLARRADSIRTVSPKSAERLNAAGLGKKTYWLPIPADERFSHVERKPEPGLIVTVSRLVSVKRVDFLLRIFAEVVKQNPLARLMVVGDGPERRRLEILTQSLKIQNLVQFVGAGDPTPYLSRASLFISLSRHEGWGIASVEAAMAGAPVVMTDTGCGSWLKKQGAADLVGVNDCEDAVMTAILAVLRRPVSVARVTSAPFLAVIRDQVSAWERLPKQAFS